MFKNKQINKAVTVKVARALGELNEQVVYVGGAVVSLYVNDPSAEDVRPTKDLDLTLQITGFSALEELRQNLVQKGFTQSDNLEIMCRFHYEDVLVDVMSTQTVGWAPSNRWFASGFDKAIVMILDGVPIKLLPLPYYLAAKFDAFFDRGSKDVYASTDFEDIVYLLDHVTDFETQILKAEKTVNTYLRRCAREILNSQMLQTAIMGQLFHEQQDERFEMIMKKLKNLMP